MIRADLESAAKEKYPHFSAGTMSERAAYVQGRLDALPEVPDPAVIEAMARGLIVEAMGEEGGRAWDAPGDGGRQSWINKARAAYAAMRGAMQ